MIEKNELVKKLTKIPREQLNQDLAELLLGVSKVVQNLGLENGFNAGKISGLVMKMTIAPKAVTEELGINDLAPIYLKYKELFVS